MTTVNALRSAKLSPQVAAASHSFGIGQAVRLRPSFKYASVAGIYYVTATLPSSGDQPQYRIRNDEERYERVATQDSLEAVTASSDSTKTTLVERTFGRG